MVIISLNAEISLGLIGGLNFADVDPYVDGLSRQADSITKYCFGLVSDIDLTEYFVLRFEPMYIEKGGKILDALRDTEDVQMKIHCSYIEFPVFIKTNHENRFNLYLLGGPVFSFLLNCETELDYYFPEIDDKVSFEADLMEVTNSFDFGVGIGGGFKIPLNTFNIYCEARYVRGLMNARDNGEVTIEGEYMGETLTETVTLDKEENKYANQGLQLLLGVTIPIF